MFAQAAVFDHELNPFGQLVLFGFALQGVEQLQEPQNGRRSPCAENVAVHASHGSGPERTLVPASRLPDGVKGPVPDTPRRHIDYPLEQVRERVLDFHSLVESQAAIDAVRNVDPQQRVFEFPRLGVGAI